MVTLGKGTLWLKRPSGELNLWKTEPSGKKTSGQWDSGQNSSGQRDSGQRIHTVSHGYLRYFKLDGNGSKKNFGLLRVLNKTRDIASH